jgi:MYXO-CTERM domain-containing protein
MPRNAITRPMNTLNSSRLNIFTLSIFLLSIFTTLTSSPAQAQRVGLYVGARALKVVRYDLEVRVQHPIARATLTQEFENPTTRALEAYFYYRVPSSATLDDLALWVNGVRRPARVLERQKAREIYQGIVNQKRDPALVERLRGNLFRIRIFPVPAKRRTRVQLSFTQPLERQGSSYRLRLQKAPVDVLRLTLSLRGTGPLRSLRLLGYPGQLSRSGAVYQLPVLARSRRFKEDIVLDYQPRSGGKAQVSELDGLGQRYIVAELPRRKADALPHLALLLDRSISMSKHLPRAKRLADALLASLPAGAHASLWPFDLLPRGEARHQRLLPLDGSRRAELREAVSALKPGRGSAFFPVVEAARRSGAKHLVLVTDGASAGHQAELEQLVRDVYDHRGVAVSVLLLHRAAATSEQLRDLCRVSGGKLLVVEGAANPAQLGQLRQLARHVPTPAPKAVGGELELLRAGDDHLLVAARLPQRLEALTIRFGDGRSLRLPLDHRPANPNGAPRQQTLPRAAAGMTAPGARVLWAAAHIDRLYRRFKLFGEDEPLRRRIVALSKRHRVASEYTAFLVTETDADYLRKTSGRVWQRKVKRLGDGTPSFHSTPEPHEWALLALGLGLIALASRRRRRGFAGGASTRGPGPGGGKLAL